MTSLWVLLLLSPALVYGASLDNECGGTASVYTLASTYFINNAYRYRSPCYVLFQRISGYGEIQLTVSGSSLLPFQCQVSVYDGTGVISKSGGSISRLSPFSRTFQSSDGTGALKLRVAGSSCSTAGLHFTVVKTSCSGFTCDNGQCVPQYDVCDGFADCNDGSDESGCFVWTTGKYVGISFGIVAFIAIASIAAVCIRRTVVRVRYPAYISSGQTVVTQSRW